MPGLIVLNMDMTMSGIETLWWLKQQPGWQEVPVVMMSNRSDADFRSTSFQLGAVGYLDKPMGLPALQAVFTKLGEHWLDDSAVDGAYITPTRQPNNALATYIQPAGHPETTLVR